MSHKSKSQADPAVRNERVPQAFANRFITALLLHEELSKTVLAAVAAIAGLLAMALVVALNIGFLST